LGTIAATEEHVTWGNADRGSRARVEGDFLKEEETPPKIDVS
jgi:hypothetical protein